MKKVFVYINQFPEILIYLTISVLLHSCIYPYDVQLLSKKKYLVFEGQITNLERPHTFNLSYTSGYNDTESVYDTYVLGAKLWITDELNSRIDLIDNGLGKFLTPTEFKGEIGKSYQIHIQLSDGKEYVSDVEKIKPVSDIDTVYHSFRENKEKKPKYRGYFSIFLDTNDPPSPKDFYRWTWKHYERASFCKMKTVETNTFKQKCCTPDCWNITQCFSCISIASDAQINGNMLVKQKIAEIPFDYATPYYMIIEQMSLSESAYKFWKTLDEQTNNTGGIFDSAPQRVHGNIKNTKDPSEFVIGHFDASAVSRKIVFINRGKTGLSPFQNDRDLLFYPECFPCNESIFRTSIKPPNWID